jgi:pyruvate/2-oxoglutarate dehydrogenase complex dihydrolipoamide acyltransferase (E2) component
MRKSPSYSKIPLTPHRMPTVDSLHIARQQSTVHALLELDITRLRAYIRRQKAHPTEYFSLTSYVIKCISQTVMEDPTVQSMRRGRTLFIFDECDIATIIERTIDGVLTPVPYVVRQTQSKTVQDIYREVREAQKSDIDTYNPLMKLSRWYGWIPGPLRMLFWNIFFRHPLIRHNVGGTCLVTSVLMFGKGTGWGIPIPSYTLVITLGGITKKPGVVEDRIEIREYLCLTVSVDHDIVDGAPLARFCERLRRRIESEPTID